MNDSISRKQALGIILVAIAGLVVTLVLLVGFVWAAYRTSQRTRLFTAAQRGDNEAIKQLLREGADINAQGGNWNMSALMWAVDRGRNATVELLLNRGADIHALRTQFDKRFHLRPIRKPMLAGDRPLGFG